MMTITVNIGTGSTVLACDDSNGSIAFWSHPGGTIGQPPEANPTGPPDVRIKFSRSESIDIMIERLSKIKHGMELDNS